MRQLLVVLVVAAAGCGGAQPAATLDIATTTSVQNSGLLDAILPEFTAASVRVHAAGSGRALQMLADGTVSLVISHAPEAEARYLRAHPDWRYRKLAFNRFVVVGPKGDAAGVSQAPDIVSAFRRIIETKSLFVSRGDQSGTHEREESLWKLAGSKPQRDRMLVSGGGMAQALRQANEMQAYTLSDQATFWQLQRSLSLVELITGDPRLVNTYSVVYQLDHVLAGTLADWLLRGRGRALIGSFRIADRAAFAVWPEECPADAPTAEPCQPR